MLSGGLTLAVLILPIVIITTSEALRAVPSSIREAAYGVGATRWEVIRSHVLPYAAAGHPHGHDRLPRARLRRNGAAVARRRRAGGSSRRTGSPARSDFQDRYTALPVQIFAWAGAPQPEFQELAAAAILVMMVVLILMNGIAIWLRNRYERRW